MPPLTNTQDQIAAAGCRLSGQRAQVETTLRRGLDSLRKTNSELTPWKMVGRRSFLFDSFWVWAYFQERLLLAVGAVNGNCLVLICNKIMIVRLIGRLPLIYEALQHSSFQIQGSSVIQIMDQRLLPLDKIRSLLSEEKPRDQRREAVNGEGCPAILLAVRAEVDQFPESYPPGN